MNMFLKNFNTAAEAVDFLREEGILVGERVDCTKIVQHYEEILNNEDLQKEILTAKDRNILRNVPADKKQEKLQVIRNRGLIPWRQGLRYLPRYTFLMKELEEAVKQSA